MLSIDSERSGVMGALPGDLPDASAPEAPATWLLHGSLDEEIRLDETAPAGRLVPMSFCTPV